MRINEIVKTADALRFTIKKRGCIMVETGKVLQVFTEGHEYVMRWMDSNGTQAYRYKAKSDFIQALKEHRDTNGADEYEVQPNNDVWALVINTLSQHDVN